MPDNMKCGRLRSSNCFVVFFPLSPPSPPHPVCVYPFETRPFSSLALFFASLLVLSFFCQYILQRIYQRTRYFSVVLCPSPSFLPIPIPPFLISSFLPCTILSLSHPRDYLSIISLSRPFCSIVHFSLRSLPLDYQFAILFRSALSRSSIYYFAKFFYF